MLSEPAVEHTCSKKPPGIQDRFRLMLYICGVRLSLSFLYALKVLEAMADGGVRAGLPRQQALMLAAQTMKGAACMVLEGGDESSPNSPGSLGHPGVLKDQVCGPFIVKHFY
jgi:hypothetical protein